MNKISLFFILVSYIPSVLLGRLIPAKYAGEFLATGVGGRPLGMGGAFVAVAEDITSVYWNPAGLISMKALEVHGMHAERFAGVINWDFAGLGLPWGDDYAIGFGFFRLGVDGIPVTDLKDPSRGIGEIYIDGSGKQVHNVPYAYKYINDNEIAFVFSCARSKSAKFSYGGSVKVIRKNVGQYGAWGLGFDFGLLINPFRSLKMGLVLTDGTSTLVVWNGGRKEIIMPRFKIGLAYPIQIYRLTILPVLDIDISFENYGSSAQAALGRLGFDFRGGLEVAYRDILAVRFGNDRGCLTLGAGLRIQGIGVDYGFSPHFDLGNTHRVSLTLFWDKARLLHF